MKDKGTYIELEIDEVMDHHDLTALKKDVVTILRHSDCYERVKSDRLVLQTNDGLAYIDKE